MNRCRINGLCSNASEIGFTLVEVLISVLVVAIALLGFASLQVIGVTNTHLSYIHSIASVHTENMAEMMRVNIAGVDTNDYGTIDYAAIANAPLTFDCSPEVVQVPDVPAFTGGKTACSPAQQAQVDAYSWVTAIQGDLPSGSVQRAGGQVSCNDRDATDANACTPASTFTISVFWEEKDLERYPPTPVAKTFATVFRP